MNKKSCKILFQSSLCLWFHLCKMILQCFLPISQNTFKVKCPVSGAKGAFSFIYSKIDEHESFYDVDCCTYRDSLEIKCLMSGVKRLMLFIKRAMLY